VKKEWPHAPISELTSKVGSGATPKGGETAYQASGTPLIRSMNVVFFGFKREGLAFLNDKQANALQNVMVKSNDILLNITGASIGRVTLAPQELEGARVNQHVCIIRPIQCLEPRFLNAYLSSPEMQMQMGAEHYGVTRQALTKQQILDFQIPLPPLSEQKRIADKLDSLVARVDACRERLDRVPGILKRFRQAVLAAATSGELTREWRDGRGVSLDSWRDTVFENSCTEITVGYVGKMAEQYRPSGIPFLRSLNVRPFKFDPREIKYVSREFHKSISKSALKPGDVVVVRTGNPGQCCVIPDSLPEANCSDLVIVRPAAELDPEFAVIFINAETSQTFVRAEQVGVAQAHFNVGSMKKTPLRLPPKAEQAEIVRRVNILLLAADLASSRCESLRPLVASLTPASLAKAFRGELVPQDPNDEPASELLARIRAAGTEPPAPKRGRKPAAGNVARPPREKSTMAKTRNDDDVRNKDYLATLLRLKGGSLKVDALFRDAELSVTDFYKQLAWEIEHGHIRDDATKLEVV